MGQGKGTGPGRPKLGRVNFQCTLAPEVKAALVGYCKLRNLNMGRVVDLALVELFSTADDKVPEPAGNAAAG